LARNQGHLWPGRGAVAARLLVVALWGLAVTMALAMSVACGGGEEEPAPATPVPQPTPAVRQITPVAIPTYDPGVPLVEFTSPGKGYSVGYPQGWEVEAVTGAGTDMFVWSVNERHLALLQVTCNRELLTPESLMRADAGAAANFGGQFNLADAIAVEIAGVEAKQNQYHLSVAGLRIDHVVAYVPGEKCGWRIGVSTYGPITITQLLPLFERIIASFQLS
jgi:hypothetical protein